MKVSQATLDAFDRTRRVVNHRSGGDPMTKQSEKDEADINTIMARWTSTGQIDHMAPGEARYGDFTDREEYHLALSRVREAEAHFHLVPAHIRKRVDNDVGKFFEFVTDPERREELVELGLAEQLDPTLPDPKPDGDPPAPADPPEADPSPESSG